VNQAANQTFCPWANLLVGVRVWQIAAATEILSSRYFLQLLLAVACHGTSKRRLLLLLIML